MTVEAGAQVIIQLVDFDEGDDQYYGDYQETVEFLSKRLLGLKVKDREKKKDRLELRFRNDDYKMLDSPIFAKGQKLLVTWGRAGEMVPPRRWIVQKVTGGDVITVMAHCRLALLDREKRSRFLENVTRSEFVRTVIEEYGYSGEFAWVEETQERWDIGQNNCTDARALNWLARKQGFVFYEDASGIHWHRRELMNEPVKWFVYRRAEGRGDILSPPKFDVNMTKGISKVRVTYRDPRTKEYGEVFGGPDDTEMGALGNETEMGNPDDTDQGRRAQRMTRVDVRCGGVMTKEEAQIEADARYYESAAKAYEMRTSVIGDSRLGAKLLVGFAGISEMFDGLYYISEAEHVVQGGRWIINLTCQKDTVNKVKTAKKARRGKKKKKNPNEEEKEKEQLKKEVTTTYDPEGNVVVGYRWSDQDLAATTLTPEEIAARNDRELEALTQMGAQSVQPDSAM